MRRDRGAVSAEMAVTFPAIVLLLALLAMAIGAGMTQSQCADAARVVARYASAGESDSTIAQAVSTIAGPDAHYRIDRRANLIHVTVSKQGPSIAAWSMPNIEVSAVSYSDGS